MVVDVLILDMFVMNGMGMTTSFFWINPHVVSRASESDTVCYRTLPARRLHGTVAAHRTGAFDVDMSVT